MTVLITLTTAGLDSGPFDLYSDLDGYVSAFESGVSKSALLAGYASSIVPDYTNVIRVKSNGEFCTNYIDMLVNTTTTTTSSTTTTTTTVAPWDPDTAPRIEALRSSTVSISSLDACSKDYDTIVYIARQIPYILTVGDVLFDSAIGGSRFNGSLGYSVDSGYWLVAMTDDISVCPGIGANRWALIDQYGVVQNLGCCTLL
jgi:hypothetical protein